MYDGYSAEVLIFSFKDGLLAKLAHDLKMRVDKFSVRINDNDEDDISRVEVVLETRSIAVVNAMKNGQDDRNALSPDDKKKILKNINEDVLHTKRYPKVRFVSSSVTKIIKEGSEDGSVYRVEGDLTLHGRTRHMRAQVNTKAHYYVAEISLHQPDFGIKPYSAAFGALKVKPDIIVQVSVPTPTPRRSQEETEKLY